MTWNTIKNSKKSLIECLNKLIDYSMAFPFYQWLNPLLNGKSNKGHLVSGIVES